MASATQTFSATRSPRIGPDIIPAISGISPMKMKTSAKGSKRKA